MSLQNRLGQAAQVLKDYFVSSGAPDKSGEIIESLKKFGATSEANLEFVRQEDLENVGVPPLTARRIVKILGGSSETDGNKQVVIVDDNPVNLAMRLKPHELVAEYDPDQPDNPFGIRLKEMSGGQPFLVFNQEGSLNIPATVKMLQELRDNYPPRTSGVVLDGITHQLYKIGFRPARFAEAHPLFHDQMLRPDGTSLGNFEWGAILFEVRQVLWLSVEIKEIGNALEAYIYDQVVGKSFEEIGRRFPQGFMKWQELKAGNQLPQMTLPLNRPAAQPKQ